MSLYILEIKPLLITLLANIFYLAWTSDCWKGFVFVTLVLNNSISITGNWSVHILLSGWFSLGRLHISINLSISSGLFILLV